MNRSFAPVLLFFVLACAITWALDAPLALAWLHHETPPDVALMLTGLGAWGPTLAAVITALVLGARGDVKRIFASRWRTHPLWIVAALAAPFALHLPATLLEVALGGHPAQWFYPPNKPEYVAALVMFSFGEEFGWRGFAYPRLADALAARPNLERAAPIVAALVVGAVWGLWHLAMMVKADGTPPTAFDVVRFMSELALWSVIIAWMFERSGRSMAVAIAAHMGGHLDNVNHAPPDESRLQVLRFIVVAIAAVCAAIALWRRRT